METALSLIKRLNAWGMKNNIDLSKELHAVELKVRGKSNSFDVNDNSRKSKNVPRKNLRKDLRNKKTKTNNTTEITSPKRLSNSINFDVSSKLIKGVSCCYYCKVRRLECREHTTLNGAKILVCKDCRANKRRPKSSKKSKNIASRDDVLNYVVSGSYGSGKRSR